MQTKPFYLSKTFWSLIITIIVVVWNEILITITDLPKIPDWIIGILAMFGLYSRWNATGPLTATKPNNPQNQNELENTAEAVEEKKENKSTENSSSNFVLDEEILNFFDNRSYFIINRLGSGEDFTKLPEIDKTMPPELFKQKYPIPPQIEKATKTEESTHTTEVNKSVETTAAQQESINSVTSKRTNTTELIDKKFELLNKITFLLAKCGKKEDFYNLPDEIKYLDSQIFKEKLKDICPEKN